MILIDAIYINYGGALGLLRYLVEKLQDRKVEFFLLADVRCGDEFSKLPHVAHLIASISARKNFYKKHRNDFSTVFCFGNVPPPVKMQMQVYTYFHNVNMLTLANCRDRKQWLMFWLKRTFIKFHRRNSDEWFVQTSNTAYELVMHLGVLSDKVKIFPFYKLPQFPSTENSRTDYIFVGEYSGSKGHKELLEAWKLLQKKGYDFTLHLTVSLGENYINQIKEAISEGVHIINHGFMPVQELAGLYMKCKATVYPSYNESFGLGLVEAMEAGCDVIASDRPFVHAICDPSEVFDPTSPKSIADAVIQYEQGKGKRTKKIVKDQLLEMIEYIMTH